MNVDGIAIDYTGLPVFCRDIARSYFEHKLEPGTGWQTILSRDLAAVVVCDETTVAAMPQIYRWLYNHAPGQAWGTREKVREWLRGRNAHVHPIFRGVINAAAREGL